MTPTDFYTKRQELQKTNPGLRSGQLTFNAMHALVPDIVSVHIGTQLDPFYNDDAEGRFIQLCFDEAGVGFK